MTKHIPNKQRRLEWEVEELQRLEEKNKLLRVIYDEAAEALNASDDDVLRQQTIVKLMRGGDLRYDPDDCYDSALERQERLGADNIKVWGPYGNPLIPVEPLVGQPGAAQVPITRQEAIDSAKAVMHTAEAKRDESAIPPDNAPNGGDWKAYLAEAERDKPLNIGVGTPINPDAVSQSFHVNAAEAEERTEQLRLAKQAEPLIEQARSQAFQEQREAREADELAAEILNNAAQQALAKERAASRGEIRERLAKRVAANTAEAEQATYVPTLQTPVVDFADPETGLITPSEVGVQVIVTQGLLNVPVQEKKDCTPPLHYFSNAKSLAIGTPCFCGVRQWGVDPAKEGAKP